MSACSSLEQQHSAIWKKLTAAVHCGTCSNRAWPGVYVMKMFLIFLSVKHFTQYNQSPIFFTFHYHKYGNILYPCENQILKKQNKKQTFISLEHTLVSEKP